MTYAPPSIDPASRGDLTGIVKLVLNKFLQGIDDMLPAKVIAYDRTTNQARVQPLIAIVTTGKEQITRAQVASVPVLQLGGGGFVVSFPIQPGDLGWIKANDRDISLFKQIMENSSPNTERKHSFEDALFIPDTMFKAVVINPEDDSNFVLQSIDGTVRIALFDDKVKITAPQIILDTPQVKATGTITADGDIIAKGGAGTPVSLHSHTHSGVQTGGGNTGIPNT